MELYKVKEFNQLLTPKKEFDNVRTYYNLDKNLNFIPRLHEAGHQETNSDGGLSWKTSVIRNENVEEVNAIPEHIMENIGNDTPLELFDESTFDDGTYELKDDDFLLECEGYVLTLDVFYQKDVRKVWYIEEPEEEETLSVDVGIILKQIDYGDVENIPFNFEQAKEIEKRLKENARI